MKRVLYLILLFNLTILAAGKAKAMRLPEGDTLHPDRIRWVDSVYNSLDTNQRIGQLLVLRAWSTKDSSYNDSLTRVITELDAGGVCFFKGTPFSQARLTNLWHDSIQTPLLVAIDAEWGMGMRLDSAFDFPYRMTLGAIHDDSLIYRMSSQIALDCRRMGVQVNFAPVVDINNNPANPVINIRSFGEDPMKVTKKGIFYMNGMQDHGVLSTGKHFPGHGDTDTDSHLSLPLISHSRERLDSVELVPFKAMIREGVRGMMIAHLYVPAFETIPGIPSTLSHSIVTSLLKEQLGFNGFVITDALDMQGVTKYFPSGKIEVMALQAGNDILLLPRDAHRAVRSIREAADSGVISWHLLEAKCRAILALKYDLGLAHNKPVDLHNLTSDLNPRNSFLLNATIFRSAVTILKNDYRILPLTLLDRHRIACVSAGDTIRTEFQERMSYYIESTDFIVRPDSKKTELDSIVALLKEFDLILLGVHHARLYPKDHYGLTDAMLAFLDTLPKQNRTVIALFGNPYILDILKDPNAYSAVVTTYQDRPESEEAAAEIIAGGLGARGTLPVTAGGFSAGTGIQTEPVRLSFTQPETFGITPQMLRKADSIASDGVATGAYPGCQVLFAKDGRIFYYKTFGNPDYSDTGGVKPNDLYDLASLTKMAGTTLAVMKLFDEGRIVPDDPIENYLPLLRNTTKGDLTIREIMSHQAGLQAWIPFYKATIKNGIPDPAIYSFFSSPEFPDRVAPDLYIRTGYRDTILQLIIRSELVNRGEYKYSDLGFYLLEAMITHLTGKPLNSYLNETFYRPLGLTTMGYRPLTRFSPDRIMPTENDTAWRHASLRGDVHDPGAAMLGGVAGHAGLFSDAFDLAVIMQMLLNFGEYGGKQYLMPATVREFTKVQFPASGNRRGLGFDKPPAEYIPDGPSCKSVSPASFGHSGFTGTYAWADPDNKLIYIFLSNRVCPDASNNRLSQKNIRTELHQAVYDALEEVPGK